MATLRDNRTLRLPYLEAALEGLSKQEEEAQPAEPPAPRLTVDEARRTITLDGTTHEVNSVKAIRWVRVLAAHPGEWISGTDLERYENVLIVNQKDCLLLSAKTHRLTTFLPGAILDLIDSKTGAGSRIRL